ncbi:hypothetical protein INR49_017520 [Caranx melampygus]|nr:hypothetical protein INR49_017520 [Caranx melampygus]
MASQARLEASLQRSASLGLEVLERASRRAVDWTITAESQTPTATTEDTHIPVKKAHRELNDAFATIADLMAEMTFHCKRFYESGCCTKLTEKERNHMFRFHSRPAAGKARAALPSKKYGRVSAAGEDFYIEVSPGSYAITASMQASQQQTQLVSVKAGESVNLTFNL